MEDLIERLSQGDVRAAARICRAVDDRAAGHRELLRRLRGRAGRSFLVGVTGNPGAGKSTVADRLVAALRAEGLRVGVVAVDPTSPFSGGAILGDRIRMQRHFEDPEVFIRSVATRGALGGLSRSALDVAHVLEAWGADVVLLETVGVGQDELDITRSAHTTLVVVAPGMGDDIQAIKAGILECADVFAVNKADHPGADATVADLQNMIALGQLSVGPSGLLGGHGSARLQPGGTRSGPWTPPIVKTVATQGDGMDELLAAIRKHRDWLHDTELGQARRRERVHAQLVATLRDELALAALDRLGDQIQRAARRVQDGIEDFHGACDRLIAEFRTGS